jgi:TonB family protein
VHRIGGDVSAPVLTSKVEPEYTEEARIAKYQGTAMLWIEVGPDGLAHNIKVVRTLGFGLDQKAVEALSRWRFSPGAKSGQPVTVEAMVEVNFRLK